MYIHIYIYIYIYYIYSYALDKKFTYIAEIKDYFKKLTQKKILKSHCQKKPSGETNVIKLHINKSTASRN